MHEELEWVSLTPALVVVATGQGRWFLHRPSDVAFGDPFLLPMSEDGTRTTTQGLLDGAVCAGVARPPGLSSDPVPLTLAMLLYSLVSSYHTTHRTPATFRIAARRAAVLGRRELAQFLERKARHESGHDQLALQDLRELGLPADRLVEELRPGTALALLQFFETSAQGDNPAGCLGYTYCLERLALLRGLVEIEAVRKISPSGADPTRFLRVHSSVGSDARHVESLVDFIVSLPASDRILIAQTAYRTAVLMVQHIYQDLATIKEEINQAFGRIGGASSHWLHSGETSTHVQPSPSSTARALRRSAVSKPSVNQS